MNAILLLMLLACDGSRLSQCIDVDLIEVNHKLGEDGREQFTQVIIWDWSHDYRRYDVVAWWLVSGNDELPCRTTCRTVRQGWLIRAGDARETWTTNDPERDNRLLLPEKYRRRMFSDIGEQCEN